MNNAKAFFEANPDIVLDLSRNCRGRDALQILSGFARCKVKRRIRTVAKLLARDTGPTENEIAIRLRRWVDAQPDS